MYIYFDAANIGFLYIWCMPRLSTKSWILISLLLLVFVFCGYLVSKFGSNYLNDRKYVRYVIQSWRESKRAAFENGYLDEVAYDWGDTLSLYTDYAGKEPCRIFLYDVKGNVVDSLEIQERSQRIYENPSVEGFGFQANTQYPIPRLRPGLYTWEKTVPFLIRGDVSTPISILYPVNTIQAYNVVGGKSFYSLFSEASDTISFLRPTFPAISFMVRPMLEWLYEGEFPQRFLSDVDLESSTSLDSTHLLIIIGHSEYWSRSGRNTFDRYIESGGNALILSGNTMWWKVRYLPESAQLICFKQGNDPHTGEGQTGNWHDHLNQGPSTSIGVSFQQGGYGRKYSYSRGGFSLYDTTYILFKGIAFQGQPFIEVPTKEYDGQYMVQNGDQYVLDSSKNDFFRHRVLGYDYASHGYHRGIAPIILFQKTPTSGTVLNVPSSDWCSYYGIGGKDQKKIQAITQRALDILVDQRKTALLWE